MRERLVLTHVSNYFEDKGIGEFVHETAAGGFWLYLLEISGSANTVSHSEVPPGNDVRYYPCLALPDAAVCWEIVAVHLREVREKCLYRGVVPTLFWPFSLDKVTIKSFLVIFFFNLIIFFGIF